MFRQTLIFRETIAKYPIALPAFALFVFSLLIYAGMLNHGFVWDDERAFVNAAEIRDFSNIPSFFVKPLALGDSSINAENSSTATVRYYRPLLATLHVLEYRWFGPNPFGYKMVNLLLNGIVVVCAFLFVRALTGEPTIAFLAALLYAANPARGEVVYWVYSDSHIFVALFSLLTLILYHYRRIFMALGCMTLALLFQEGAILIPAVLIAYHLVIRQPESPRWQKVVPFFLLAAVYLVVRHLAAGALSFSALDFASRLHAGCYLLVKYVKIFFVPDAPVTMYRYVPGMFSSGGVATPWIILGAALILLLGSWIWWRWRSWGFWYAWFLIWLVLSLNVGSFADYLMAEKALYLAALGPCVLLAKVVYEVGRYRWIGLTLFFALLIYQAATTVSRGQYWTNTITYIAKLLEFEPEYDVAQYMLGIKYLQAGEYEKAVSRFEVLQTLSSPLGKHRSIQSLIVDAYNKWGQQLAELGEFNSALAVLEKSRQLLPNRSDTYSKIGYVYYLQGDWSQAASYLESALRIHPNNIEAYYYMEKVKSKKGI